jgi:polyphosphate glucokinase
MTLLGIDIGGSGIKGAPVDLSTGSLTQQRYRVATPQPASVDRVVAAVGDVVRHFAGEGRVGIAFPGVVVDGVIRTAANVDHSWIGAPAAAEFGRELGRPVTVVNDADAAGSAEMAFGAGRDRSGVTIVLTFGTGIGSAVFHDGVLVPNTELGHLRLRETADAEQRTSDRAREADSLSWPKWAHRVEDYLRYVEQLLRPDLFIIGGGVSKKADKFLPFIDIATPIVAAGLYNDAGIVGAALAAQR